MKANLKRGTREWYEVNKAAELERCKDYRERNKELLLERSRLRYSRDQAALRQYQREYRKRKPKKAMLMSAKHRAKKYGLAFEISEHDFEIPELCPVLGVRMVMGVKNSPTSPSLDRIDPSKGYVKGNVRVISNRANTLKNNASIGEIAAVYEYMLEHL